MKTQVIKIDSENIEPGIIKEAAGVIDGGGLVAFGTETVYGIGCKVEDKALRRLGEVKKRPAEKFYTLHVGSKSDLVRYVPWPGPRVEKLVAKALPGPLTIVFQLTEEQLSEVKGRVDGGVFESLYAEGSIGVRWPASKVAMELLKAARSAVVAPSANISGREPAVNAEGVLEQLDGKVDMVLDSGECKYKQSSTVIRVFGEKIEVLREGVYSREEIEQMSTVRILFVCTGNTCRSPMAEAMFKKYLAEKFDCEIDNLEKIGYKIQSAGTMGISGIDASSESVAVCAMRGIELGGHRSVAVTEDLLYQSDHILAMCRNHLDFLSSFGDCISGKCELLAESEDIIDPIGQSLGIYNSCADKIEKSVKIRIGRLFNDNSSWQ